MTREKIIGTKTSNPSAVKLKAAMLEYHDFQNKLPHPRIEIHLNKLSEWQSKRLKHSHEDLYSSKNYHEGLNFLFTDLYSAEDFSQRDKDLERIFPKMVKYLPKSVLETVCLLVELNLLTQMLDQKLAHNLFEVLEHSQINEENYCEAYRNCNNQSERAKQIALISDLGSKLDKYARSSLISFTLRITEGPADMAGLKDLHQFLNKGFSAFHHMKAVKQLMGTITERETTSLNNIFAGQAKPFEFELVV